MRHRSLLQQLARGVLFAIALILPHLIPLPVPLSIIFLATILAYEGARRTLVGGLLGALLLLELIWGIELGLRSAAFAVAVLVFLAAERWLTLSPWAYKEGWQAGDFLRGLGMTVVLASVMTAMTAVFFGVLYGHGLVQARLALAFDVHFFQSVILFGAIFLVLFRRIDEPIRRPSPFPT